MKRVAIIGSPGAGKSIFARQLAEKTGLPLIHLDYYYHDKNHDYENDKEAWRKKVQELTKGKSWILDGNYSSSFDIRLKSADTIIAFEVPRHLAIWRILKRRIAYRNKRRLDMPEGWKEKINVEFLKYVWNFNKVKRPLARDYLEKNKDKQIIILKTSAEARELLEIT